jgi:hypothetical protein
MDGTGDYDIKWNKLDSGRYISRFLLYMKYSKILRQESRKDSFWEEGKSEQKGWWKTSEGNGSEYDQSALYTCVKMSWWNPLFCTIDIG